MEFSPIIHPPPAKEYDELELVDELEDEDDVDELDIDELDELNELELLESPRPTRIQPLHNSNPPFGLTELVVVAEYVPVIVAISVSVQLPDPGAFVSSVISI